MQCRDKWHKSLAAKEWAKEGGLSIQEAECHLDAELFLNEYPQWDVRGLHCPFILQRMFVHATESGWKEAERLIWCSCWHGLHRLDPEADASTIQVVGYWTSREEIGDLYHQVYMLKRLSRPPLCEPKRAQEVMRDILSSLKDCLRQRRGEQSGRSRELEPASAHPSHHWDRASQRERQDTSGK